MIDPDIITTDPDITTTDPDITTTDPDITTTDPDITTTDPDITTTDPDITTTDPDITTTDPDNTRANKKQQPKHLTMMVVSHSNKGFFLHIHKSGGTYIETVLRLLYDFEEIKLKYNSIYVDNIIKEYGLFGANIYENPSLLYLTNYFKFTMVRNPYTRAISGYKYLKQFSTYKSVTDLSFTDFFLKIIQFNENSTYDNFFYIHILLSQTDSICDYYGDMTIDYIAKYENFLLELDIILEKLNIQDRTKHYKLIEKSIRINVSEKPDKNITINNDEIYYTQESLDIINKLFKHDFINFGYEMIKNIEEMPNYLEKVKKEEKTNENLACIKFGINKTNIELDKSFFLSSVLSFYR